MENQQTEFCGVDISISTSGTTYFSKPWNSLQLLDGLSRDTIILNPTDIEEMKQTLWIDLCSEYDAEHFCNYIKASGISLSSEFSNFESLWRVDEWNHYLGFRAIYSTLYEVSEVEITRQVSKREYDFQPIAHLLKDEFALCLVIAYDEIATTISYSQDLGFYKSFGFPKLQKWIRLVARDEGFHFGNIMRVIHQNFPERIPEISCVIDELISWDLSGKNYKGTFVLDHDTNYFTPEFLNNCRSKILNYKV